MGTGRSATALAYKWDLRIWGDCRLVILTFPYGTAHTNPVSEGNSVRLLSLLR